MDTPFSAGYLCRRLYKSGPLGLLYYVGTQGRSTFTPGSLLFRLASILYRSAINIQILLDRNFDRRFGTDTSGFITLDHVETVGPVTDAVWYEPTSERVFNTLRTHLPDDLSDTHCMDLGSGKGRILLLASRCGFRHVTGVEFARELHETAQENAARWTERFPTASPITCLCEDAARIEFPDEPLLLFMFSPFTGDLLQTVLDRLETSLAASPRPCTIVFYGRRPDSIHKISALQFASRDIRLRPDWTRTSFFKCILFRNEWASNDAAAKKGFQPPP